MRLLILFFICSTINSSAQWVQEASFPGTERDDASVFHSMSEIYVGCGRDINFGLTNDWYKLNLQASPAMWTPIASLPASGRQYCTTFQQFDKDDLQFLLFGGQDAVGALHELWAYDKLMDSWMQLPSMPAPGRSAASGFYLPATNEFHVVGGVSGNGTALSEHWAFNLSTMTWTQLSDFPGTARHRAAASGFVGTYWVAPDNVNGNPNKVILAGGADSNFTALADAWEFSGQPAPTWNQVNDLPAPRYGMAAAPRGIFAGGASNDSTYHSDIFYVNTGTFQSIYAPQPSLPDSRKGAIIAASSTRIFWGLGIDEGNTRFNDIHSFQSAFTHISESKSKPLIIYPNPAHSLINISAAGQLSIFDCLGKLVSTEDVSETAPVNVTALANGAYQIRLVTAQGQLLLSTLNVVH